MRYMQSNLFYILSHSISFIVSLASHLHLNIPEHIKQFYHLTIAIMFLQVIITLIPFVVTVRGQTRTCDISHFVEILQSGNIDDEKTLLDTCNMCLEWRSRNETVILGDQLRHVVASVAPCCTKMPQYGKGKEITKLC